MDHAQRLRVSNSFFGKGSNTLHWDLLCMAVSQIQPTLKLHYTYFPPINLRWTQDRPLSILDEVESWMRFHGPNVTVDRECGALEFQCTLNTPCPERLKYLLNLCKERKTFLLRRTLLETQNLLLMPLSFWEGADHQTNKGGCWVRAFSEELASSCIKCERMWPAHQLAKEGCTECKAKPHRNKMLPQKKGARPKLMKTLGIVMRLALLEEIEKTFHQNLILDSTLTLPHIQCCGKDMMQEMRISTTDAPTDLSIQAPIHLWFTAPKLSHPLFNENHDRPLHPLMCPFLHEYLFRFEGMDDDDGEMGHLYTVLKKSPHKPLRKHNS